MEKKIKVLCDLGVGGQRGRVFDSKCVICALTSTDYKNPPKVIKRLDKGITIENALTNERTNERTNEIVVLGGIGKNDRKNRDGFRVLSSKGTIYSLMSHISQEQPLVLRKWRKDLT